MERLHRQQNGALDAQPDGEARVDDLLNVIVGLRSRGLPDVARKLTKLDNELN